MILNILYKCLQHPKYICLVCPYVDAKITWFCFLSLKQHSAFGGQPTTALELVRIPQTNLLVQCGVSVLWFSLENKENRLGAIERHSQGFYCFSVSHFGCRILVFLPSITIKVIFIVSRHLFGGLQTCAVPACVSDFRHTSFALTISSHWPGDMYIKSQISNWTLSSWVVESAWDVFRLEDEWTVPKILEAFIQLDDVRMILSQRIRFFRTSRP